MRSHILILIIVRLGVCYAKYTPTWDSLDKRPIPEWYDQAKVGIFVHWGVYSVPAFGSEWFWKDWKDSNQTKYKKFMEENYRPDFTYQEFASELSGKFYDPIAWANLFKEAGAKYVVLTSKHHEGYTLWPSTYSFSWNAVDVGLHRDVLGDLTTAVRNVGLRMGYYYSLLEWYNPRYMADQSTKFQTTFYSDYKVQPELRQLVEKYKPDIIWSDGEWDASDIYWRSKEFLAWLYNESPVNETVVVNDRWGSGNIICHHGDFYTCADRFNPGILQSHKWENAMTIDKSSWGYRENASLEDYVTSYELIKTLVETISCGGNILINVGPTKTGVITPIFQERLLDLGKWLRVNGEAIYDSSPWIFQNDSLSETWYTTKNTTVYAITLEWPKEGVVKLGSAGSIFLTKASVVRLLGYNSSDLVWSKLDGVVSIELPNRANVVTDWAWTLQIRTSYL